MKTLVVLIAAVACALAEPPVLFRNDYPGLFDYRYALGHSFAPVFPFGREVIPGVVPYSNYYTGLKSQYYDRDYIGSARYGHIEPGQSHYAVQDVYGNKVGGFSYYNAEGKLIQTSYIADGAGYRVSSNDLPVDTPEVAAAKAAHFAEHEKVRLGRAKRDIVPSPYGYRITAPLYPHAYPTTLTTPVVKPDGFLADTPEVVAAKSHHFAEVAAAKSHHFAEVTAAKSHHFAEVTAAKSHHFAEVAAANARNYDPYYRYAPIVAPITPITSLPHFDYRYISPVTHAYPTTLLAAPVVTPDGFLADTPEVATAKAEHFAEVAQAKARSGYPYFF